MKITKKVAFVFSALAAGFVLSSCQDLLDIFIDSDGGNSGSSEKKVTATKTENWAYSASNPIFEADSSVLSVNVSGSLSGKSLYVVNANKSSSVISSSSQRFVSNGSQLFGSGYNRAAAEDSGSLATDFSGLQKKGHFVPKEDILKTLREKENSPARSAAGTTPEKVTQLTLTVDSTSKKIYVDDSVNMNSYSQKAATLRAVGTYCNVWVVNEYYTSGTASGSQVDSSIAKEFADTFDAIYPMIKNVFGNESDELVDYANSTNEEYKTIEMGSYSDTGTKINIVIYDIAADSWRSEDEQTGIMGYFYSKDYVTNIPELQKQVLRLNGSALPYSNAGKYFYIDSAFSVENFESVVSTLAHEFQHMVNFNQKTLSKNLDVSTAYNEMLSMLCEDMMQSKLGLTDEQSVKGERLPGFNTAYYRSGILEYLSENSALSYSTSYTFGAWLCRQYGGAALVKAMMTNNYKNEESIVRAVNYVNKKNYTFETLFRQFLLMLTGSGTYTMNKDAGKSISYTGCSPKYEYPMTAINLWSNDFAIPETVRSDLEKAKYTDYNWCGPYILKNGYATYLRPEYGIEIYKIGTFDSGTTSKTITFTSEGDENLTMYLIIQ